jgi:hypothetical protein
MRMREGEKEEMLNRTWRERGNEEEDEARNGRRCIVVIYRCIVIDLCDCEDWWLVALGYRLLSLFNLYSNFAYQIYVVHKLKIIIIL